MTTITVKARPIEDAQGRAYLPLPVLTRRHCDMPAFRAHRRYGSYANSDLFPAMLARIRLELSTNGRLYLDTTYPHATIDATGFLAVATLEVSP